jgi:hypothetical protein
MALAEEEEAKQTILILILGLVVVNGLHRHTRAWRVVKSWRGQTVHVYQLAGLNAKECKDCCRNVLLVRDGFRHLGGLRGRRRCVMRGRRWTVTLNKKSLGLR